MEGKPVIPQINNNMKIQIKQKRAERRTKYDPSIHTEYPESITEPNEAMSVKDILERHARGMVLPMGKVPLYSDTESFDQPDLAEVERMDLIEKDAFIQEIKDKRMKATELYAQKKAEEDKAKAEKAEAKKASGDDKGAQGASNEPAKSGAPEATKGTPDS